MVKNNLLRTGGIYRLIYTTWKSQERPISFILYSGPTKIHALNINAKTMSVLDIRKFVVFIKRMKSLRGIEKYTGRILYRILKRYFPDIIKKTYRTYLPSNVIGFSLVSTGIIPEELYTDYEKSHFNKFIYEQSKYDSLLRMFNFESKTGYIPPKKPNIYNPQTNINLKNESEIKRNLENTLSDQKNNNDKPIVPGNQNNKDSNFFSIYDED